MSLLHGLDSIVMKQIKKIGFTSSFFLIILYAFSPLLECSSNCRGAVSHVKGGIISKKLKYDAVFPAAPNSIFVVQADIDLHGKTYLMPEDVTLVSKKGVIKNGTLIGNRTLIKTTNVVFDKVAIKGEWNVNKISTSLFKDLSYKNALRDVMALTNPMIQNEVIIGDGHYMFYAEKDGAKYIRVFSNTNVSINGVIEIVPNSYKSYNILCIEGKNIKVSGTGTIIGDKRNHLGNEGEWGMGLYVTNSSNCVISGLSVKDCWGDCVYVGKGSKDIVLSNLTLVNGRRQGISVTDGENIKVSNTTISGVSGTSPGYAIDVEPNKQNKIRNVTIENVITKNCDGGFVVSVVYPNVSSVDGVYFNKCRIENVEKRYSIMLNKCKNVVIKNSYIGLGRNKYSFFLKGRRR